ncbi:triphosphoribosyl-dephospho-CoA synthase CitG [Flintibacter sp. KGMB00164]|uniref:triphosphoribosyl-dephospho-CoA synthase CitG n=1 Tax=Flintibacter sp. KGMB00164 TaxID=2610895 RepID=UPI0012442D23|nr:triphosphoribosyl-dephospho-CoA synthase CitG [Flintibacter sp. KGMB00164]
MEHAVTLMEMLGAREARAMRQQQLLEEYQLPVISFCLNIAGPVKNSPVLRRAFREGLERLVCALLAGRLEVVHREEVDQPTGCEALWVVRGDGRAVKELCVELEDRDALGRLFDLDVLDPASGKWDRTQLGQPPRKCLVCGKEGKGCASRRLHTVEELQEATQAILENYFSQKDQQALGALAAKALLYEVCTTPKPGLVDRKNNGSHRDMDVFTFLDSTAALLPYFEEAVRLGMEIRNLPPQETFRRLRQAGAAGERAMFRSTGGVNTHKGAVFTLGTVCAAAGRLWTAVGFSKDLEATLALSGEMSAQAVQEDFEAIRREGAHTTGQRLYLEHGLEGIRGELSRGLPAVAQIGLPTLRRHLAAGDSLEQAGVQALLALMAQVVDTNLIARGGLEGQQWAMEQTKNLPQGRAATQQEAEKLDRALIERNLSPGGCADLLAITYFLEFLSRM